MTSSSLFSQSFGSFDERLTDNNKDPQTLASTSTDSRSDLLSSPERYADSLNMTMDEVRSQKEIYETASRSLQESLEHLDNPDVHDLSPSKVGILKHEMICEHRLKYGRHPFVCSKCWSYLPVCVCHLAKAGPIEPSSWKYPNLQVLVWTHHREWGLTSNTGSILALTLGNNDATANSDDEHVFGHTGIHDKSPCRLLMKGLPKHDRILQDVLDSADENNTPNVVDRPLVVVLWPSSSSEKSISLSTLRDELEIANTESFTANTSDSIDTPPSNKTSKRVVLLAVDGTWRNARRMVAKLPAHVKRLDLDEQALRWNDRQMDAGSSANTGEEDVVSILSPLRKRGESGVTAADPSKSEKRQVCTAEAVVAALHELGAIDTGLAQHVLGVTQAKVDRVRRYRGKVQ